ncbi:VC0807 family protein [Flammeovirga sp. EKP202]|uniref:VC0807 family protein n=1 Tax=Flammeovirga sp. EKP202 TaxID=2770592 RepID=UPI00165FE46A|nr:VC0807 family protein [Flammeovirga sp. EKP202]MBD0401158.1 MFS transporter [Flammeovirga sp. EKP202]
MQLEKKQKKKESPVVSLLLNIVIPSFVMSKLSDPEYLGDLYSVLIAIAFPLVYGIYDFIVRKDISIIAVLGLINVALTGGIKLLHLPADYIAIKEAMIPGVIGVIVFISTFTKYPLVEKLLYNENFLDVKKIETQLKFRNTRELFEKRLKNTSFMLAGSFFLSSALNYILAKVIVKSDSNTVEFTKELGQMTAWSWVVIAIPSTIVMMGALMYLIKGVKEYTGFEMQEVLVGFEEVEKEKEK